MQPFAKTFNSQYPNPAYYPMQESKSVPGATVKAALGISGTTTTTTTTTTEPGSPARWQCAHNGAAEWCKGIRVAATCTGGNLVVHLAEDPEGQLTIYDIPDLTGDGKPYKEGLIFDYVYASDIAGSANTDIDLDKVTFLL